MVAALADRRGRSSFSAAASLQRKPPDKKDAAAAQAGADGHRRRAREQQLPVTLAANGNIAAWQEAIVGSESNGLRLAEVRVNVGDVVKKGQVLATFSPETMQAEVAQARAGAGRGRGQPPPMRPATPQRARTLAAHRRTERAADQPVPDRRADRPGAGGGGRGGARRAAGALAADTQVLAPDSGVISARTATVGAVVRHGTELFRLIRQGRLEWRAEVTSAELGRIAPGTPAHGHRAPAARRSQGRVRMVGPTVDPQTRNRAGLRRPPERARAATGHRTAGMFARGEFELGRTAALTVPQPAVVVRDGFNYVFLLRHGQPRRAAEGADRAAASATGSRSSAALPAGRARGRPAAPAS